MSKWRGCTASLLQESPFYAIFEHGVPIKSLLPSKVSLVGSEETEAYVVAWSGCTDDQKVAIAQTMTELRGGTADEFFTHMASGGELPIRVSQTRGASAPLGLFL
jgi:hypothetical protein